MNNKKLGTAFEREFCKILSDNGYWVHFISPNETGSQPFDIIAVKDGKAYACDCKTSIKYQFSISRLEDNQIFAFEKWMSCGNNEPYVAIKWNDKIVTVPYLELKAKGKVDLREYVYDKQGTL